MPCLDTSLYYPASQPTQYVFPSFLTPWSERKEGRSAAAAGGGGNGNAIDRKASSSLHTRVEEEEEEKGVS
jgi:hypothetical protein